MPRRFAIADIHGCDRTFAALLEKIDLRSEDHLYLLGDYVDRGPRSAQVIQRILDLLDAGYRIQALRGNHEQFMVNALADRNKRPLWYRAGGRGTRASYVAPGNPKGKVLPRHREWLETLPYYILLPDYVLVHAGLNFRRRDPLKGRKAMLNARHYYHKINDEWLGRRLIVHGHTPTTRTVIERSVDPAVAIYPAIDIDAGCTHRRPGMGHLCALNLDDRSLTFVPNTDR